MKIRLMVSIISMMLHLLVVALLLLMLSSSFPAAVIVVVEAQGFDDSIAATCNLCEDGSPLPDPNMDMGRNQTCQTLQQDFIDENEYICVRVQATVGVHCGCNNPIATQQDPSLICRLCDDDTDDDTDENGLILDSLKVINWIDTRNNTHDNVCGAIELFASFDDTVLVCEEAKRNYKDECCIPASSSESDNTNGHASSPTSVVVPSPAPTLEEEDTTTEEPQDTSSSSSGCRRRIVVQPNQQPLQLFRSIFSLVGGVQLSTAFLLLLLLLLW